jgi:hypothetical protein
MKKILLSTLIAIFSQGIAQAQQSCSTAQVINAGVYGMTAINGTQVPGSICISGSLTATAANWYKYTPSQIMLLQSPLTFQVTDSLITE